MVQANRLEVFVESWQVQQAKARLSEVMARAEREGPQIITCRGSERAVLQKMDDYKELRRDRPDLKAHLLSGPKLDGFEVDRDPDAGR